MAVMDVSGLAPMPDPPSWTDVGTFWGGLAVGLLAAVVTAVGAFAAYRSNRPKRLLRWRYTITPITDDNMRKAGLRVSYKDEQLKGALTADIHIRNACRKDFYSSDFEDGSPIEVRIKGRILDLLACDIDSHAPHPKVEIEHDNDGHMIRILPSLIPAGASFNLRVLLADETGATIAQYAVYTGKEIIGELPEIKLVSPLRDVVVRCDNAKDRPASKRIKRWTLARARA